MAACEMPWAAASFLKAASQGSKAPVLRQFAWAHAVAGKPASSAPSTAPRTLEIRVACIVMVSICPIRSRSSSGKARLHAGLPVFPAAPAAACSPNGNSPILPEGPPQSANRDPADNPRNAWGSPRSAGETTNFRQHHDAAIRTQMATAATMTTLRATRSGDRTMRTLFVLALGIGSALAMGGLAVAQQPAPPTAPVRSRRLWPADHQ